MVLKVVRGKIFQTLELQVFALDACRFPDLLKNLYYLIDNICLFILSQFEKWGKRKVAGAG